MKVSQWLSAVLIVIFASPQSGAGVQPKPLTQNQLQQFVHCVLGTKYGQRQYGPNLRFQYILLPPSDEAEEGQIVAVFYRSGTLKKGLIEIYGFRRKKCMEFEEGNFATLISTHGKPDVDPETMGNGGIGTYNEFIKRLHQLQKLPLTEMDISRLPRSCERCITFYDQFKGDIFWNDLKNGTYQPRAK